jgi:hypothetical protein
MEPGTPRAFCHWGRQQKKGPLSGGHISGVHISSVSCGRMKEEPRQAYPALAWW